MAKKRKTPANLNRNIQQILKDRFWTPRERAERAATFLTYTICIDEGIIPPSVEELQEAFS